MSRHLPPELLAAYIDRTLSLAEFNRANDHLAECPECLGALAGALRTMALLAAALPEDEQPARQVTPRRALLLAVLFCAAAVWILSFLT